LEDKCRTLLISHSAAKEIFGCYSCRSWWHASTY